MKVFLIILSLIAAFLFGYLSHPDPKGLYEELHYPADGLATTTLQVPIWAGDHITVYREGK
jgi:hypothetical protein